MIDDTRLPLDYGLRGALRIYFYRLLLLLDVSVILGAALIGILLLAAWWPHSALVAIGVIAFLAGALTSVVVAALVGPLRVLIRTLTERALIGDGGGNRAPSAEV